jgi:hypothetical protein
MRLGPALICGVWFGETERRRGAYVSGQAPSPPPVAGAARLTIGVAPGAATPEVVRPAVATFSWMPRSKRPSPLDRATQMRQQVDFILEDEGDGWWGALPPLACTVLDVPRARLAGSKHEYWLVRVRPAIPSEHRSSREASGEGEPAERALVYHGGGQVGRVPAKGAWALPVYPIHPAVPEDRMQFERGELWEGKKVRLRLMDAATGGAPLW